MTDFNRFSTHLDARACLRSPRSSVRNDVFALPAHSPKAIRNANPSTTASSYTRLSVRMDCFDRRVQDVDDCRFSVTSEHRIDLAGRARCVRSM